MSEDRFAVQRDPLDVPRTPLLRGVLKEELHDLHEVADSEPLGRRIACLFDERKGPPPILQGHLVNRCDRTVDVLQGLSEGGGHHRCLHADDLTLDGRFLLAGLFGTVRLRAAWRSGDATLLLEKRAKRLWASASSTHHRGSRGLTPRDYGAGSGQTLPRPSFPASRRPARVRTDAFRPVPARGREAPERGGRAADLLDLVGPG